MTPHLGIAILAGCALFFGLNAAFWAIRGRKRRREDEMLARLRGDASHSGNDPDGRIRIRERRSGDGDGETLSRGERARRLLSRAGMRLSVTRALLLTVAGVAVLSVVFSLLLGDVVAGVMIALVALAVAYGLVARRAAAQVAQVEEQMPRALEMLVFGLRAGHAFEESLALAAGEVKGPLAAELSRCHEEYKLGRPIEQSLEAMRARWSEVEPLGQLVEAVVVLKRTGGNLVQVIESVSETIRAQAAFEAKHRAMMAEGKLSGYILMALPGAALAFQAVLVPNKIRALVADSTGQMMLLAALTLWMLGVVWVLRLLRPGN